MVNKMTPAFQKAKGGLFETVTKADVGDNVTDLEKNGGQLMSWADPFYSGSDYPRHVVDAAVSCLLSGRGVHYTMPIGNPDLKTELAKHIKRYNHIELDPARNILITPGSDSGLFFAILPFIRPGDEVMVLDPSYPNNAQDVEICGGTVVYIPCTPETNYHPSIEEFQKRLTPKTKMVILTNPNNPTTTVYRREWMQALSAFILENDLICVADQAFEYPVFDGLEMVTIASLPGMWERTITVCSFSKGMGLSGFRVGYLFADDAIMDKLFGTAVAVIGAANTAAQAGAIAALQHSEYLDAYAKEHLARRNMVYEYLRVVPGVSLQKSESGFLTWLDVSRLGSSEEIATYLLKEAHVAVNAGSAYGLNGEGFIRLVHGTSSTLDALRDTLSTIQRLLVKKAKEKGVE